MPFQTVLTFIFGGITVISLWYSVHTVFRLKKQISEMQEILEDVKNGN